MDGTSISCFSSFIYLENIFCINRSYLFTSRRKRIIGNFICIIALSAITTALVQDFLGEVNVDEKIFQGVLAAEFLILAFAARYRNVSITTLKNLDQKCGIEKTIMVKLEWKVQKETLKAIISIIVDVLGLCVLGLKTTDILTYTIMFAAHEAETVFFALIIEGMNLRLLTLMDAAPSTGSRVYRHILLASSHMNIEFTPRIVVISGTILFTTISYSCSILLMFNEQGIKLAAYLLWRELKSMYCLWQVCSAAFQSDTICSKLAFTLAKKLAFDPAFNKAKHPQGYSVLNRWYQIILQHRPRYVRGTVLSIGLSTPLHLMDISINYVLIIIQIYVAYK